MSLEIEYPCTLEKNELPMLSQAKSPDGRDVSITTLPCSDLAVMRPSDCL